MAWEDPRRKQLEREELRRDTEVKALCHAADRLDDIASYGRWIAVWIFGILLALLFGG